MLILASISESLVNETAHFVREAGLPAIFLLMTAESALIPIPSEATMLFAGFAVAAPGAATRRLAPNGSPGLTPGDDGRNRRRGEENWATAA